MVLGMVLGFGFNKTKVLAAAEKFVQQGKLQNAIAEYDKVSKDDPKDLTVLNTIGDLYARLGQVDKAVEYFKRVGDAYAANGFTVKAIAMYKKTTKLSPGSMECIQKLGELYTQQGLYSDARAQLVQVAEHYMRKQQLNEAAHIFQKLLELDPENASMQTRLAELYVKIGKSDDARNIYFRAAESLHQRNEFKKAEDALQRVLALDPQNSRALALGGRIALDSGDTAKGVALLEKVPDLDSRPDALQSLLRGYLACNRVSDAEPVARKLFSVHNDLTGIMSCAESLLSADMTQPAIALFEDYADRLLASDQQRFIQALSTATSRVKGDISQLEVLRRLYAKAGDETHGSELAELLAHASVQSGDLEKARDLYRELSEMEPDNPLHLQNYKQVLAKLGEEPISREMTPEEGEQAFLVDEIEPVEKVVDQNYPEEIAQALQTALTESELFDSYNVPNKAIPPLEAVLPRAPFDVRVNQRLASLYARTGRYAEAAKACSALTSVYASAGHAAEADQYKEMAAKYAQKGGVKPPEVRAVSAEQISPLAPPSPPPPVIVDIPDTLVDAPAAQAAAVAAAPMPPAPAARGTAHEVDLSDEWERMIAGDIVEASAPAPDEVIEMPAPAPAEEPVIEQAAPEIDEVGDLVQEIKFYISQSMWNEAGTAIDKLAALDPQNSDLASLRKAHAAGAIIAAAQEPEIEVTAVPTVEDATAEETFVVEAEPEAPVAEEPLPSFEVEPTSAPAFEEPAAAPVQKKKIDWSIPLHVPAAEPAPEPEPEPVATESVREIALPAELPAEEEIAEPVPEPLQETPEPAAQPKPVPIESEPALPEPVAATAGEDEDILSDFVLDLENSLGDDFTLGTHSKAAPPAPAFVPPPAAPEPVHAAAELPIPVPVVAPAPVIPAIAASTDAAPAAVAVAPAPAPVVEDGSVTVAFDDEATSALSDLFNEFKEELEDKTDQQEDPETHYNLGVAFKEMGLLDEAIGELQKVCQAVDKGAAFSQTMQAYTWLAHCFVEKNVPEASFKWYQRALKLTADEETRTAIHYELACAYELANRRQEALDNFMEVYTTNIDFRDVAERIKALKS